MTNENGWLLGGDYPARQKMKKNTVNILKIHTCWNNILYVFYSDAQNEPNINNLKMNAW